MRRMPLVLALLLVACGPKQAEPPGIIEPPEEPPEPVPPPVEAEHVDDGERLKEIDRSLMQLEHGVGTLLASTRRMERELQLLSRTTDPELRDAVGAARERLATLRARLDTLVEAEPALLDDAVVELNRSVRALDETVDRLRRQVVIVDQRVLGEARAERDEAAGGATEEEEEPAATALPSSG